MADCTQFSEDWNSFREDWNSFREEFNKVATKLDEVCATISNAQENWRHLELAIGKMAEEEEAAEKENGSANAELQLHKFNSDESTEEVERHVVGLTVKNQTTPYHSPSWCHLLEDHNLFRGEGKVCIRIPSALFLFVNVEQICNDRWSSKWDPGGISPRIEFSLVAWDSSYKVFDKMSERDVFSWTSMLCGNAKHGEIHRACEIFDQMSELISVNPNDLTFPITFKASGCLRLPVIGQQLHGLTIKHGQLDDAFVGCSTFEMYCKTGLRDDAGKMFDEMPHRNLKTWNACISNHVLDRRPDSAVSMFIEFRRSDGGGDAITFSAFLNACADAEDLKLGIQLHGFIIRYGYEADVSVGNELIDLFGKCQEIGCFEIVFSWDEDSLLSQLKDGLPEDMEVLYVGTLRVDVDPIEQHDITQLLLDKFKCIPTFLPPNFLEKFYDGLCKKQLWSLFHYMLPFPADNGRRFDRFMWEAYVYANKLFSQKVIEVLNPEDDFVWIHDHHLMVLPTFLRRRFNRLRMGFFLHSPWPSSEIYRTFPVREEILKALLNCDLIGFHTFDYARHFLSCCSRMLGLEYQSKKGYIGLDYHGRTVGVKIMPVGVHMGQNGINDRSLEALVFFRRMKLSLNPNYATLVSVLSACGRTGALMCGKKIRKNDVDDPINIQQRQKIKDAMIHGWSSYEKYAWDNDELQPQSKNGIDSFGSLGAPRPFGNSLAYLNAAFLAEVTPSATSDEVFIDNVQLIFGAYGIKHVTRARVVEEFLAEKLLSVNVLFEDMREGNQNLSQVLLSFDPGGATSWLDIRIEDSHSFNLEDKVDLQGEGMIRTKGKRAVVRWFKFFRWKTKKDYEIMTAEEKIVSAGLVFCSDHTHQNIDVVGNLLETCGCLVSRLLETGGHYFDRDSSSSITSGSISVNGKNLVNGILEENGAGHIQSKPWAILDRKVIKGHNRPYAMVQVQQINALPEDATGNSGWTFVTVFQISNLEDKVVLKGNGMIRTWVAYVALGLMWLLMWLFCAYKRKGGTVVRGRELLCSFFSL